MWVNLRIANQCLSFHGGSYAIAPEADPAYQSFLNYSSQDPLETTCTITGNICEDLSSFQSSPILFNSGGAWKMHSNGENRTFVFQPDSFSEPVWCLSINQSANQGQYFLNKQHLNSLGHITNPLHYPLDQLLLMYHLQQQQSLIIHSAGICLEGHGFLFAGVSGGGKTTLSSLFHEHSNANILSDDRMIVQILQDGPKAFGTPWPGEGGFAQNTSMPLHSLIFLQHGTRNNLSPLTRSQSLQYLLPVVSVPWFDSSCLPICLNICDSLLRQTRSYLLEFAPNEKVVPFLQSSILSSSSSYSYSGLSADEL